jgi:hypothetical protein
LDVITTAMFQKVSLQLYLPVNDQYL